MAKFDNPLNNLKIASPCSQDWEGMFGNERKRFCGECNLNVYNLSGMSKTEAENLLINAEGRVCVRFYQRADGTVLTQDCPVGWAKVKQRTKVFATAALSLIVSLFSGLMIVSGFKKSERENVTMGLVSIETNSNKSVRQQPPTVMGNFAPIQKPTPEDREIMGEMEPVANHTMGKVSIKSKK